MRVFGISDLVVGAETLFPAAWSVFGISRHATRRQSRTFVSARDSGHSSIANNCDAALKLFCLLYANSCPASRYMTAVCPYCWPSFGMGKGVGGGGIGRSLGRARICQNT